jgi:hypothetical protein
MFPNVTKHANFDLQIKMCVTFTDVCTSYLHVTFKMLGNNVLKVISIKPEAKYGSILHAGSVLFTLKKIHIFLNGSRVIFRGNTTTGYVAL